MKNPARLLLLLPALLLPRPATPAPTKPAVRRVVLANGLRLLCKQNDASEIVAIYCQVQAGLPDEPMEGETADEPDALTEEEDESVEEGEVLEEIGA